MSNNQFNEENWNTVKRISNELDQIVDGNIFICPVCGERVEREETEDGKNRFSCGCVSDEEGENFSLYDYFADALDIDYICNYRKEYTAVRVCIACGGPNIYINTWSGCVELRCWSEKANFQMFYSTIDAINDYFAEYFNCLK